MLKVVGQIGGPTQAVAVQGSYAYVGVGLRLIVLDSTSPANPREVGATEPFGWYVEGVTVAGNTAFVAAGGAGLYIVDISDRAHPTVIGSHDTPGYAESVVVAGKYAYIADGPDGLRVVDIRELAHPTEVGRSYTLTYAFDVAIEGRYAYIAAAGAGLLVADISEPGKPRGVGVLDTPGCAYGLAVSGSMAYVADGWGGLRVVDIADPSHPREIGSADTPGWVFDVVAAGDKVYLADGSGGGWVMSVSDPTSPTTLADLWGSKKMPGQHITKLTASQQFVYAVDRSTGVQVIDVSNPAKPKHVGFYKPASFAGHVAVAGNYAYVGGTFPRTSDLRVLDVSDPTRIREIPVLETVVNGRIVEVQGNFLYMFGWRDREALQIFELSNPAQPRTVSWQTLEGPPVSMFLKDGTAYITTEFGFEIVDISNPASPSKLGVLDFTEGRGRAAGADTTNGVAVSGNFAYVTQTKYGLMVIDVSNPAKPTVVTSAKPAEMWKALSLVVAGDFAYVASHGALEVVDISNPKEPKWVAKYPLAAYGQHLTISDGVAYVAEGPGGLQAFDVSNPRNPVLIGSQTLTGRASAVYADSNYIYVATGEGGLYVLERLSGTTGVRRISAVLSDRTTYQVPAKATLAAVTLSKVLGHVSPGSLAPESSFGLVDIDSSSFPPAPSVSPGSGQIWMVSSATDSGPGTLRSALEGARIGDTITFDLAIFPPKSPVTIRPTSALPYISQGSLTIDASNAGVILDGSKMLQGTHGFIITSDYNTVKGLQVINFPGAGIGIAGASYNTIGGDRVRGTGPSGEGNVISGNRQVGVGVSDFVESVATDVGVMRGSERGASVGNRVIGNYIGLDWTGTKVDGVQGTGVFIGELNSSQNVIGGTRPSDRNIISGNVRAGVSLMGRSHGNTVVGNYIGTDASGSSPLGNQSMAGITIEGGFGNVVKGNLISGNDGDGVIISDPGASDNEVVGNLIGTDPTGTIALGNGRAGISINESFNKVGGTTPEERNVISGNAGNGVRIGWLSTTGVVVIGNFIGTDVTGTKALGNLGDGVWLTEGTYHDFIGGATAAERNVVAGNRGKRVGLQGAGIRDNFVAGNYIGTASDGVTALPNQSGIVVQGTGYNFVQANLVAYNRDTGIAIQSGDGNRVHHNSLVENGKNSDGGNGNRWDDGREGNYWSDYRGQDANGDGIGDTPYQVPPNGVDRYPLMKPEESLR